MEAWWGDTEIPEGEWRYWTIGPLRLALFRGPDEWRIACRRDPDPLASDLALDQPGDEPDRAAFDVVRFGFRRTTPQVSLVPVPADRAALVESEYPFRVPPGEQVSIFLSTPVFVRIGVEGQDHLHEVPTSRLSDTWFGPNPRQGELCYAAKTSARMHLENLPVRPHRAVSEMRIQNDGPLALPLERVRLPLPSLSLYEAEGRLWTEKLRVHSGGEDEADVHFSGEAPASASGARRVGPRRGRAEKRLSLRIFGLRRAEAD